MSAKPGMNRDQFVDTLKRNGMTVDAQNFASDPTCGFTGWTGLGSYEAWLESAIRQRDQWRRTMVEHV